MNIAQNLPLQMNTHHYILSYFKIFCAFLVQPVTHTQTLICIIKDGGVEACTCVIEWYVETT
jgi:hypothetical protein